jgi:hypothetical protein
VIDVVIAVAVASHIGEPLAPRQSGVWQVLRALLSSPERLATHALG